MSDEEDKEEESSGGGLTLQDVWGMIARHLVLVLFLPVLCGALATAVAMVLPNRFEASATVQIDARNKKVINIEGVLSDIKTDNASMESEIELIRSRSVAIRVIDELKLRDDPEFNGVPLWRSWLQEKGILSPKPGVAVRTSDTAAPAPNPWTIALGRPFGLGDPSRDEVAIAFESRMKVSRIRNSLLIEIRYSAGESVKAARIANAIADAYVRSQIESKTRATEAANEMLDDRLKNLRDKVAAAEREVETFKAANGMFDADGQPLDGKQLQREMEALLEARTLTSDKRAKYEQARRMMVAGESQDTLAEVLQNNAIRQLREEYIKAGRREAELATKYGPRHPEMEKVVADVAKAQAEMTAEINKVIRSLKSDLAVAQDKERQQEVRLERLKEQIAGSKEKQWRLKELEREASATKQLYESILLRNKQTEETIGLQLPDSRVVAKAEVPLAPSSPKRKLIVIGGVAAGLLLGLGTALLLELVNAGIARPADAESKLRTEHLASLPLIPAGDAKLGRFQNIRTMIALPDCAFAEEIRTLRHELDRRRHVAGPRVMLICSAEAMEGKTVTAANLALYYAMTRQRTLLIDGDMRSRKLSIELGVTRQAGLLDVLQGRLAPEVAILKDRSTNLHFMPAASVAASPHAPAEALIGDRMHSVLTRLAGAYDVIVVDSPALLGQIDARVIADSVDLVVLVAKWRAVPIARIRAAIKTLGANAGKLAGVVIAQVESDEAAQRPVHVAKAPPPPSRAPARRVA